MDTIRVTRIMRKVGRIESLSDRIWCLSNLLANIQATEVMIPKEEIVKITNELRDIAGTLRIELDTIQDTIEIPAHEL